MVPALMAARPLIKYGVIIGVPLLILSISHTTVYFTGVSNGEASVHEEWDAAIAKASASAVREVVKADAMAAVIVKAADAAERDIRGSAEIIKRKAAAHAKTKPPIPLSPGVVHRYDELRRMSNEAGLRVPAADPGAGTPSIPSGEVRTPAAQLIQIETDDGELVELTTEELEQAVIGSHEMLALVKKDYRFFSAWNDGREKQELERIPRE